MQWHFRHPIGGDANVEEHGFPASAPFGRAMPIVFSPHRGNHYLCAAHFSQIVIKFAKIS
jgi:hypothetical protein